MDAKEQRKQEVLAKIRAARPDGNVPSQWLYVADVDPGYLEASDQMYVHLMTGDGALPLKVKEMLAACLLAARGYGERVPLHIERAMKAGATEAELLEGFEVSGILTGTPTVLIGVEALAAVAGRGG